MQILICCINIWNFKLSWLGWKTILVQIREVLMLKTFFGRYSLIWVECQKFLKKIKSFTAALVSHPLVKNILLKLLQSGG